MNSVVQHRFNAKKTFLENILAFEDSSEQYEKASGDIVSDDLKTSIVLNSADGPVKQHLLLNMKTGTTYSEVRQFILSYEQTSRWTTADLINSGTDHGPSSHGCWKNQRRMERQRQRKERRQR